MILKFLKTNWFQISLALIVLAALVQRVIPHSRAPQGLEQKEQKMRPAEKYTASDAAATTTVQMSIGGNAPQRLHDLPALDDATALTFLRRFGNVAVGEHKKYGIPASVILACAYVNSFAGQRATAQNANNFFALSCTPSWSGKTYSLEGRCFRHYDRPWDSFRDFSQYLSSQSWYAAARKSAGSDWRKWVTELSQHDVSDIANFETELKKVTEAFRLFELNDQ